MNSWAAHQLAILTVTFHPDISVLERQCRSFPADAYWIVIDNDSSNSELSAIELLINTRPRSILIRNASNVGLATALNEGAQYVIEHLTECQYLLLMDQDSVPTVNAVDTLLTAFLGLKSENRHVACVGPRLVDVATGLQHGFHKIKAGRWIREFPADNDRLPVHCTNINGSGTFMRLDLFKNLGGLEEAFFIDHIDTEWSFRVVAQGGLLYGIPQAVFEHGMGERGLRFWFMRWRVWPYRSPLRHYYLFRNAVWLMKRPYVPVVWKFWAGIKLVLTLVLHAIFDSQRSLQCRNMIRGGWDGMLSNALPNPSIKTVPANISPNQIIH